MAVITIHCEACGKDLLPGFVETLNELHGTRIMVEEIPAWAEASFKPGAVFPEPETNFFVDLCSFMMTLLIPQPLVCENCYQADGPRDQIPAPTTPGLN